MKRTHSEKFHKKADVSYERCLIGTTINFNIIAFSFTNEVTKIILKIIPWNIIKRFDQSH